MHVFAVCRLSLFDNKIGDVGATALAKALERAPLQSLDVSWNDNLSEKSRSELNAAWQKAGKSVDKLQT